METKEGECSIVVDNGTKWMKAGRAGEDKPSSIEPTVVAKYKTQSGENPEITNTRYYAGEEALSKRGIFTLHIPIEKGAIDDFDLMEKLWHYTFRSLKFDLKNDNLPHPVLLTEPPLNPKPKREQTTQIFFEKFHSPAIYLGMTATLELYAYGKTTGFVVDVGHGLTSLVPINEGTPAAQNIITNSLAGKTMNEYFCKLLETETNLSFRSFGEREIVRDIKEKLCFVKISGGGSIGDEVQNYELPDGEEIKIRKETLCKCPEILFNPELLEKKNIGRRECAQ